MTEQAQINTDFDLEGEYKPDPLIPQANYLGSITGVTYNPENYGLTFIVTLSDNGGYMSDGETPIDGGRVFKTVWFPRPDDWEEKLLARFLVDVRFEKSDKWVPMPILEIPRFYLYKSLPGWADTALKKVTHIRVLFPL